VPTRTMIFIVLANTSHLTACRFTKRLRPEKTNLTYHIDPHYKAIWHVILVVCIV